MLFDPIYLFYGCVFACAILLIEGIADIVTELRSGHNRRINRRMRMLGTSADTHEVMQQLLRKPSDEGALRRLLSLRFLSGLDRLIGQSGLTISTGRIVMIMVILWIATLLAMDRTVGGPLAALSATVVSIGIPLTFLYVCRQRRMNSFFQQLPDALDLVVRSLRAGHPVPTAMGLVAQEMRDPIGTEFGIAVDEMTYGKDLLEALDAMGERMPHRDLKFMVGAVKIQYGTGGNLAGLLAGLAGVLRDRMRLTMKVQALTAEGRISALVLSLLPFVFIGGTLLFSPTYFGAVKDKDAFLWAVGFAALLLLAGIGIMYKMVKVRI